MSLFIAKTFGNNVARISSLRKYSSFPWQQVHIPVLLDQVIEHLNPKEGGTYCDLTFGEGGYTKALLDNYNCKVIAIDQDPIAYEKALQMADIYKDRLYPILGKFGNVGTLVNKKVDGIMMDIGVSSGQIETPERGFSYKLDGPLDMRMFSRGRQHQGVFENEHALLKKSISAYEIVNFFSREQIADIIYQYGGDRLSRKIAAAIVTARQEGPIETTSSLATVIQKACPQPRWQRGNDDMVRNSAARTFQALRIYINDELGELEKALSASEYLLAPDGRLAVVTFHSLEDRIVKNFMYHCAGKRSLKTAEQNQFDLKRQASRDYKKAIKKGDASFSRKQRVDKDEKVVPSFELTPKKHIEPTEDEVECNPRSRSAKLRVAKRTDAPALAPFGEPEFIFDE